MQLLITILKSFEIEKQSISCLFSAYSFIFVLLSIVTAQPHTKTFLEVLISDKG